MRYSATNTIVLQAWLHPHADVYELLTLLARKMGKAQSVLSLLAGNSPVLVQDKWKRIGEFKMSGNAKINIKY